MEKKPHTSLLGLDPAELLNQGLSEDTILEDDSSPFQPPSIERLAAIFPQFEILALIGKGGMGAVYKVRQKDLDRIVALKILPPSIGQSPEFSSRFTREAKSLAKLNHPGIVTIHEFGQQQGLYFILMEYVDGMNLGQVMKASLVTPAEALAIVPQICDALQYAHDQGIVHRDIKPENLLLDRKGRVKIADFGIAKVVAVGCEEAGTTANSALSSDHTLAGKVIGTPRYMAPEQIASPGDVDHRADIYALGIVFYQMLTGELPSEEMKTPSKRVEIDIRLDEMILRALEKEPELRFQSARDMKTMVEETTRTITDSEGETSSKQRENKRWWLAAGAITAGAIAAGFLIGLLIWQWGKMLEPFRRADDLHPLNEPFTVQVMGEVNDGGELPIRHSASLLDALATAGGWTGNADLEAVEIKFPGESEWQTYDLNAILKGDAINPILKSGAQIRISNH